ncbi:hypothetical protein AVEN_58124-1, partial [Araneus ventricosus]
RAYRSLPSLQQCPYLSSLGGHPGPRDTIITALGRTDDADGGDLPRVACFGDIQKKLTLQRCDHLAPVTVSCDNVAPVTVSCDHLAPVTVNCDHFAPVTVSCDHFAPVTLSWDHLAPVIVSWDH